MASLKFVTPVLFLASVCCVAATVSETTQVSVDPYHVVSDPGNFTIDSVTMATDNGHWATKKKATVTIVGKTLKKIVAGTVKWQLYEAFVHSFSSQGYANYFTCNNKGCDPTKPIALALKYPTAASSSYTLTFDFVMGHSQMSGDWRIVIYGQDQDHFPYDFSATISYNYTAVV